MGYRAACGHVSAGAHAGGTEAERQGLSRRCQGCAGMPQEKIEASHFSSDTIDFLRLLATFFQLVRVVPSITILEVGWIFLIRLGQYVIQHTRESIQAGHRVRA